MFHQQHARTLLFLVTANLVAGTAWGLAMSRSHGTAPSHSGEADAFLPDFCRRTLLLRTMQIGWAPILAPSAAEGADGLADSMVSTNGSARKPFAPTEALLPATRVRLLLDRANDLAERLSTEKDPSAIDDLARQLEVILASEKSAENESGSSAVRWAFNVYTANLRFGETYTVTASPKERSEYIRKYNGLPDVKQVILADLDLRDLYRNQILTAIDDSRAEFRYQKKELQNRRREWEYLQEPGTNEKSIPPTFDAEELISLLKSAQTSCQQWFGFISEKDVKEALDVVLAEN